MKRVTLPLFVLLFGLSVPANAQFDILNGILASGGGTSTNTRFMVHSTVALSAIGVSQNSEFILGSGFWFSTQDGIVVSTEDLDLDIPSDFVLDQNYPNPFNPTTVIRYGLPEAGPVRISVYNLLGQQVQVLIDAEQKAGYHTVEWKGRMQNGSPAPSGLYLYVMESTSFRKSLKMMLVK